MKLGVLASGKLGYEVLLHLLNRIRPHFIATDRKSQLILELAMKNGIPIFVGNPRDGRLSTVSCKYEIDLILSINYLFLVEKDAIAHASMAINFHGSLLPKYRGRTPHVWSIINNEKWAGVSAHLIDDGCDSGDLVLQERVQITEEMTGADLLSVYEEIYVQIVDKVIFLFERNELRPQTQDHGKATYFGKRGPDDGLIDWSWQKERIRNWVRAQAFPYPGAFSFIQNEKFIIDKICYSDLGFRQDDPNGLIIHKVDNLVVVKTPNGAVELEQFRDVNQIQKLVQGQTFGNGNWRI